MKTAMKEMIQNIIDIESKTYNQEQLYMLTALKVSAIMLLKLEKEQIVDAYYGNIDGVFGYREEGGEYYNNNYGK
jgi:hypothetical protein